MDALAQDLRVALRRLAQAPGFTAIILLTLALGIGANSAIFAIVNAVLLEPLPFPDSDRLVALFHTRDGGLSSVLSAPNFLDTQARARTLSAAAAFDGEVATLTGRGDPLTVTTMRVTDGFFDLLRIPALHGRTLRRADNQAGQHRVVVLGYPLWRERFGSDPRIVGRSITLDGDPYLVVGVMPAGFAYPATGQMWVPFEYTTDFLTNGRGSRWLRAIGRVAPGPALDAVRREIETIGAQLAAEHPVNTQRGQTTRPLHAYMFAEFHTPLLILLGASGFVLLIACANVANLLLARAVHRQGEIALRAALGGSRARLLRQMLTESLLLATGGGLLGLLLAVWSMDLILRVRPAGPLRVTIEVDPVVLLFTAAVTIATGVTFGCIPAWQATRVDLAGSLAQSGRGAAGSTGGVRRLRGLLVVSEMALAVLLLTGAGLLIRSFVNLQQVDPGFQADRALSFRLSLPDRTYGTDEKRRVFFEALLASLRAAPGVESAAAISYTPMWGGAFSTGFTVTGRPALTPRERPSIQARVVTPDYFRTVAVPLRRGRVFTEADVDGARPVVLLSESAVRRHFPEADPIGQHVTLNWGRGQDEPDVNGDVIGVVGDVKEMGLDEPAEPQVYVAFAQVPRPAMSVLLRTKVPPVSLAGTVRQAVRAGDPQLAIDDLQTLDQVLADETSSSRFYMLLLGIFATAALLLAAIGIFGVMSNAVAHRTREIGIRLALGAQGSQVRGLVLRDAFLLASLGIVVGVAASLPLTTLLATLLFELAPTDPLTLTAVVSVLLGVALLASYLPAWRASHVDPVIALRAE